MTLDEIEVIPSVQKVKLEPKKQNEFIVNVVTNGKPENGYEVGTTEVVGGKTVQVAGAESILKKIRKQEDGHFPAVWQSLPGILRMFDVDSNLKGCYTYG